MAVKNIVPPIVRSLIYHFHTEWDIELVKRSLKQIHFVADLERIPWCVLDERGFCIVLENYFSAWRIIDYRNKDLIYANMQSFA